MAAQKRSFEEFEKGDNKIFDSTIEEGAPKPKRTKVDVERSSLYSPHLGYFQVLPAPLFELIFSHLEFDVNTFMSLRLTCKLFYHFSQSFWNQNVNLENLIQYIHDIERGLLESPLDLTIHCTNVSQIENIDLSSFSCTTISFSSMAFDTSIVIAGNIHFPSSLTILDGGFSRWITSENFKYLPPFLTELYLANSKAITDEALASLPSTLTHLDLRGCSKITDKGLSYLECNFLSSLTYLDLSSCKKLTDDIFVKGYIPPSLTFLDISYCIRFTGAGFENLPSSLASLRLMSCDNIRFEALKLIPRSLTELDLAECIYLESLQSLPSKITDLNISHCQMREEEFKYLPQSLKRLNLSYFNQPIREGFYFLPSTLTTLELIFCKIQDEALRHLPRSITDLNLSDCGLTDAAIQYLPSNLIDLDISSCKFQGSSFQYLPTSISYLTLTSNSQINTLRLKSLELVCSLDLSESQITDQELAFLPPLLTELDLTECNYITGCGLQFLPTSLKVLILSNCSNFNGLPEYFQNLISLVELNLEHVGNVNDQLIPQLPSLLTSINLSDSQITNESLKYLPLSLERLYLSNCSNLTDDGMQYFSSRLTFLSLLKIGSITDEGLKHLPSSLVNLYLGSPHFSIEGLFSLPSQLRYLNVRNCSQFTSEIEVALKPYFPKLSISVQFSGFEFETNSE